MVLSLICTPTTSGFCQETSTITGKREDLAQDIRKRSIVIGVPCLKQDDCKIPELEDILREAYSRLDISVYFEYLPQEREIFEASLSRINATSIRTKSAINKYAELVAVDVPLFKISYAPYSRFGSPDISSIDDFKGHVVGVVRGNVTVSEELQRRGIYPHIVDSIDSGMKMVESDRLDYFIVDNTLANDVLQKLHIVDIKPSQVIHSDIMYHAVNKNFSDLIPSLALTFGAMLQDGSMRKLAGRFAYMVQDGR